MLKALYLLRASRPKTHTDVFNVFVRFGSIVPIIMQHLLGDKDTSVVQNRQRKKMPYLLFAQNTWATAARLHNLLAGRGKMVRYRVPGTIILKLYYGPGTINCMTEKCLATAMQTQQNCMHIWKKKNNKTTENNKKKSTGQKKTRKANKQKKRTFTNFWVLN